MYSTRACFADKRCVYQSSCRHDHKANDKLTRATANPTIAVDLGRFVGEPDVSTSKGLPPPLPGGVGRFGGSALDVGVASPESVWGGLDEGLVS